MISYQKKVSLKKRVVTGLFTLATVIALLAPVLFPVKIGEFGLELFWILSGLFIFAEMLTVVILLKMHKLTPYELVANLTLTWHFSVWLVKVLISLVLYIVATVGSLIVQFVFGTFGILLSLFCLPFTLLIEASQNRREKRDLATLEKTQAKE